jgi:hypothetical protein
MGPVTIKGRQDFKAKDRSDFIEDFGCVPPSDGEPLPDGTLPGPSPEAVPRFVGVTPHARRGSNLENWRNVRVSSSFIETP